MCARSVVCGCDVMLWEIISPVCDICDISCVWKRTRRRNEEKEEEEAAG